MIAVDFEQRNNVLGKPEGMTDEQCYGLPVHHYNSVAGYPAIISCWKLNKEDLETIAKTGTIWVNTVGHTLSPLQSEDPFHPVNIANTHVPEERYQALNERLPREIFDRIHQDIGAASMCWTSPEGAGIFRDSMAAKLAFELCHFVADQLDKAKQNTLTNTKLYATK